jgi:hypothetical protein
MVSAAHACLRSVHCCPAVCTPLCAAAFETLFQTRCPYFVLLRLQECKRSAVSYISPEHILLAMLSQSEATGKRVLERCAAAAGSCWLLVFAVVHLPQLCAVVYCV